MEKRKLKLDEIKVESFITSLEGMLIDGGRPVPNDDGGGESVAPSKAAGVYCGSYEGDPPVWDSNACNSSPYPCGGGTGIASQYPCATAAATCANSCGCSYGCSGYGSCQCAGNTGLTVCYC